MSFQYFFFDLYIGNFLQVLPIALLAGVACFLVRRAAAKRRGVPAAWPHELAMALFACYLAGLWALVLTPNNWVGDIWYRLLYRTNPRPEGCRLPLWDVGRWSWSFRLYADSGRAEALGNLLLFVPMGFFLPLLWPRLKGRAALTGLCVSLGVELLQMPIGRSFDLRDLLMNTAGTLAGMLIFRLFRALFPRAARAAGTVCYAPENAG